MDRKQFLRRKNLAERYQVTERTIERRVELGLLPRPEYFGGRFPLWDPEIIEQHERQLISRRAAAHHALPVDPKRAKAGL